MAFRLWKCLKKQVAGLGDKLSGKKKGPLPQPRGSGAGSLNAAPGAQAPLQGKPLPPLPVGLNKPLPPLLVGPGNPAPLDPAVNGPEFFSDLIAEDLNGGGVHIDDEEEYNWDGFNLRATPPSAPIPQEQN
ncbi:hypothetical protein EJ06DRAFT_524789 [Trichodelitschia bisporula]|uniref:Uncharacterized protein n=1 Tax=Trichodelitschia bisporula TaxID=703511 RepID=A0A6G1HKP1_9PEZI|nr:hypothetical protein EJ06DRAFT_524789 [Trichodelitschia bisporula]